jgi:hypothetical protein
MDAAIHMTFGREIDDRAGFVLGQQRVEHVAVTDIGLHKDVSGVAVQAGKRLKVACIGEFVDVDDWLTRLG